MCSKEAIKVKQGSLLEQKTDGAAGYDLCSTEYAIIEHGEAQVINTGVSLAIPPGSVGMICSRSGLAAKNGVIVLNAPGIIDSDYRGELKVILANMGGGTFTVEPGDRIAQLLFIHLSDGELDFVPLLADTARGTGGLGSTGVTHDESRAATETV